MVLRGVMQDWPAMTRWQDLDYLRQVRQKSGRVSERGFLEATLNFCRWRRVVLLDSCTGSQLAGRGSQSAAAQPSTTHTPLPESQAGAEQRDPTQP